MTLTNEWRKAARSGDTNCVEVRKASVVTSADDESRVPASSTGDICVEVRRVSR